LIVIIITGTDTKYTVNKKNYYFYKKDDANNVSQYLDIKSINLFVTYFGGDEEFETKFNEIFETKYKGQDNILAKLVPELKKLNIYEEKIRCEPDKYYDFKQYEIVKTNIQNIQEKLMIHALSYLSTESIIIKPNTDKIINKIRKFYGYAAVELTVEDIHLKGGNKNSNPSLTKHFVDAEEERNYRRYLKYKNKYTSEKLKQNKN